MNNTLEMQPMTGTLHDRKNCSVARRGNYRTHTVEITPELRAQIASGECKLCKRCSAELPAE